ncbi:hypothetical protein LJR074_002167 [Acidovorax sp. LjRoot74]|uniref:hypothetical protein n=1 Tax=Acidovorax sp. LjRoot74 TaxID=3342337 RepID=UPI003ECDF3CC
MTPDQINAGRSKPVWRCNTCGATSGLKWWNGLSVAVCRDNPQCGAAESQKFADAMAEQEAQDAYAAEWLGGGSC